MKESIFKVGDAVKYCPKDSMLVWYGTVVSVGKKYMKIKYSDETIEKVAINLVNFD